MERTFQIFYEIGIRSNRKKIADFIHIAALTWLLRAYPRKHLAVIHSLDCSLRPLLLKQRLSIYGDDYLLAAGQSEAGGPGAPQQLAEVCTPL